MPRFTQTDLLIATAAVAFIGIPLAVAIPILADEKVCRVKCASNLRQIGQALLLYSNENYPPIVRLGRALGQEVIKSRS